jgi:hypothetical protein
MPVTAPAAFPASRFPLVADSVLHRHHFAAPHADYCFEMRTLAGSHRASCIALIRRGLQFVHQDNAARPACDLHFHDSASIQNFFTISGGVRVRKCYHNLYLTGIRIALSSLAAPRDSGATKSPRRIHYGSNKVRAFGLRLRCRKWPVLQLILREE